MSRTRSLPDRGCPRGPAARLPQGDLADLVDAAIVPLAVADERGTILKMNRAAADLLGVSGIGSPGLRLTNLISKHDCRARARLAAALGTRPATPRATTIALATRRADGGAASPLEAGICPLGSTQVLVSFRTRDAAPAPGGECAERLRLLLDALPDIVVMLDRAGRLRWGNAAAFAFFGPDLVGMPLRRFRNTGATASEIGAGVPAATEWFRRQDGASRMLAWQCRALAAEHDCSAGIVCCARDVTDDRPADPCGRMPAPASAPAGTRAPVPRDRSAAAASTAALAGLTPREMEIAGQVMVGLTNKEIGRRLCISHRTVEYHRKRILGKTGAASFIQLAASLAGGEARCATARPDSTGGGP